MRRMRTTHIFRTIGLLTVALPAVFLAQENTRDAALVVEKVRQTYANLTSWHFEHRITIDETVDGGSAATIADVILKTANQGPPASAGLNQSICKGLCRLEWSTTTRGSLALIRDGQATWLPTTLSPNDLPVVDLRLTDTFTAAKTGDAVSQTLFRFEPTDGARGVQR